MSSTLLTSETLLILCKALADPLRQDVMRLLKHDSFGVQELCHITTTPQPGMSHHLKILTSAGLLETKREGTSIFYRRALLSTDNPIRPLTLEFLANLDQIPLTKTLEAGRQKVLEDRGDQAAQFFARCSEQLKENQELVASFEHYAGCVTDLINSQSFDAGSQALEVGAGESPLLAVLAAQFDHILAVDNAENMLNKTRQIVAEQNLSNVTCLLKDYADLKLDTPINLLVCNMVLHHLPAPADFFKKAATLLVEDGRLLLIDLCSHQQDWTREICGDLWLGFDPDELNRWAEHAGFCKGQDAFLGLKNGFQIQLRIFNT